VVGHDVRDVADVVPGINVGHVDVRLGDVVYPPTATDCACTCGTMEAVLSCVTNGHPSSPFSFFQLFVDLPGN